MISAFPVYLCLDLGSPESLRGEADEPEEIQNAPQMRFCSRRSPSLSDRVFLEKALDGFDGLFGGVFQKVVAGLLDFADFGFGVVVQEPL